MRPVATIPLAFRSHVRQFSLFSKTLHFTSKVHPITSCHIPLFGPTCSVRCHSFLSSKRLTSLPRHANSYSTLPPYTKYSRYSVGWWKEVTLIMTIFAISGSTTMAIVRPALHSIGVEGSWKEGPWSFRIISLLTTMPFYSVVLLTTGTVLGRHAYFKFFVTRMWSRFIPKLNKSTPTKL